MMPMSPKTRALVVDVGRAALWFGVLVALLLFSGDQDIGTIYATF